MESGTPRLRPLAKPKTRKINVKLFALLMASTASALAANAAPLQNADDAAATIQTDAVGTVEVDLATSDPLETVADFDSEATELLVAQTDDVQFPSLADITRLNIARDGTIATSITSGPIKDDTLELGNAFEGDVDGTQVLVVTAQRGFYDVFAGKLDSTSPDEQKLAVNKSEAVLVADFDRDVVPEVFVVIRDGDKLKHRKIVGIDRAKNAGNVTGIKKGNELAIVGTADFFAAAIDNREIAIPEGKTTIMPTGAHVTTFTDDVETYAAYQKGQVYQAVKVTDNGLELQEYEIITPGAIVMASLDKNGVRTKGFTQFVPDIVTGKLTEMGKNLPLEAVLRKIDIAA